MDKIDEKVCSITSIYAWVLTIYIALTIMFAGCVTIAPTPPHSTPGSSRMAPISPPAEHDTLIDETMTMEGASVPDITQTPLTLETCIAVALRNNPQLSAEGWDVAAAASDRKISASRRWPSLNLAGSYFHYQDEQRLVPPLGPGQATYFTRNIVSGDIMLRLPLYAGGRIVNEIRAAELLALAAEQRLARTKDELVFNVKSTYFAILAQRHVVESLEFSRSVLTQHLDRVHHLIAAQKAAKVDALRTEVRLASLEQQLLQEKNLYEIQHRVLANLMGLEKGLAAEVDISGELPESDMEDIENLEEIVARAFRQRKDYAAAISALEAQARRVDIARGEQAPQVSLEGVYGIRWGIDGSGEPYSASSRSIGIDASGKPSLTRTVPLGGGSLSSTWGPQGMTSQRYTPSSTKAADAVEDVGRIGVTVDVPVFTGGRIRAQIARERARLHAAQQRLRKLELQIQLDVETAVLNVNSARERVGVTQKSIAEAEESLRIELEKYDFGKGAIVDVLDAQAALLNVQTTHYRALADMQVARAQLAFATGEQQ